MLFQPLLQIIPTLHKSNYRGADSASPGLLILSRNAVSFLSLPVASLLLFPCPCEPFAPTFHSSLNQNLNSTRIPMWLY